MMVRSAIYEQWAYGYDIEIVKLKGFKEKIASKTKHVYQTLHKEIEKLTTVNEKLRA